MTSRIPKGGSIVPQCPQVERRGVALTNVQSGKGGVCGVCNTRKYLQHYNHLPIKIITGTDQEQG